MNASKLFLHLASGNNHTRFDHAGGSGRSFPQAALTVALLTCQNFSTLVGRGYHGRSPAIESNLVHAFRWGTSRSEVLARPFIPLRAERGLAEHAIVTRREYLPDARFGIVLREDGDLLAQRRSGFANPRWRLWLGRKSCIPSVPILPELHTGPDAAFRALLRLSGLAEGLLETPFEKTEEVAAEEDRADLAADASLAFGQRRFALRGIRTTAVPSPG